MGSQLLDKARAAAGTDVQRGPDPEPAPATLGALLSQKSIVAELQRAMPAHINADRMARIGLTVIRKTKDLHLSTPESFMGALLTCSQLGLEPGALGEAWLVPYKDKNARTVECQLIIGYQGYAKLFWQHPLAKLLDAQMVREGDFFDYQYGLEPFLRHKPGTGDRGPVVAYYAVAALTSGGSGFVVLSPEDARALRGKEGPNGGIKDPMRWMERKTAVRQLVKLLPKSPELAYALAHDETVRRDLSLTAIDDPGPVVGYADEPAEIVSGHVEDDEPGWPEGATPATPAAGDTEWPAVAKPGQARP